MPCCLKFKTGYNISNMEDETELLTVDITNPVSIQLRSNGLRFVNGIASRYTDDYDPQLEGIVSESELKDIIRRLNETIQSYWPCNTCYAFGYACTPFTFGLSLLLPRYCASQAEIHAQKFLRNVSLKAKFYDRKICFYIVKTCCDSYVEIKFPRELQTLSSHGTDKYDDNIKGPMSMDMDDRTASTHVATAATASTTQSFQANATSSSAGRRVKGN